MENFDIRKDDNEISFDSRRVDKWSSKKVRYTTKESELPLYTGDLNYEENDWFFGITGGKSKSMWDMKQYGEHRSSYYSRATFCSLSKNNSKVIYIEKTGDEFMISTRDYFKKKYVNRCFGSELFRKRNIKRRLRQHEINKDNKGKFVLEID